MGSVVVSSTMNGDVVSSMNGVVSLGGKVVWISSVTGLVEDGVVRVDVVVVEVVDVEANFCIKGKKIIENIKLKKK